ncbi:pentapeptide repeat-containing protein [Saccharothrix sp. HUAS TT1]|uniref:pentapeptide repeat-containing protein n=1 Tax=unclassified Saccharothrix TaxID=2593673 RepID=UPI00345B5E58
MAEDRPAPASLSRPKPGEHSANHLPVPLPTPSAPRTPLEPMPRRVIATVAAVIAVATIGLVIALWWAGTAGLSGAELVSARFNALRTGLSIGVGGGGIFALYLAWRRQHATEIGLVQKEQDQADVARAYELQRETAEHTRLHAERVAATTERDAEARRITDLYAKSVEQLGSDKAPVRHGGLYALERLAQDHPALRQTVVNVLCAYLRAPFDLPTASPDADADRAARDEHRERVQEGEVRLTAQRILTTHLRFGNDADNPEATLWADIDLDLTAAILIEWDMNSSTLRNGTFRKVIFVGAAQFNYASFTGNTSFDGAKFTATASFNDAKFSAEVRFDGATFTDTAMFDNATFAGATRFSYATFTEDSSFVKASFAGDTAFFQASFKGQSWFIEATFDGHTIFEEATFSCGAQFEYATFSDVSRFWNVTFAKHAWFNDAKFSESAEFQNAKFDESFSFMEIKSVWVAELEVKLTPFIGQATFTEAIDFGRAELVDTGLPEQIKITQGVRFDGATFSKYAQLDGATLLHSPVEQAINYSSWPDGWNPTPDHVVIEGREGTWHHLMNTSQTPANNQA